MGGGGFEALFDDLILVGLVEKHPPADDVHGTPCVEPLEIRMEGLGRRLNSGWRRVAQTKVVESIEDLVEHVGFGGGAGPEEVEDLVERASEGEQGGDALERLVRSGGGHVLRHKVIERVIGDDGAERVRGEDDAVVAGWCVIGNQVQLGPKQISDGLGAFFQNLRACGEVGAEGVGPEVDGEIADGGCEEAIDEEGEDGEGDVAEDVNETQAQGREGYAQMQPAEDAFGLLVMIRVELAGLGGESCRSVQRPSDRTPERGEEGQGHQREEKQGDEQIAAEQKLTEFGGRVISVEHGLQEKLAGHEDDQPAQGGEGDFDGGDPGGRSGPKIDQPVRVVFGRQCVEQGLREQGIDGGEQDKHGEEDEDAAREFADENVEDLTVRGWGQAFPDGGRAGPASFVAGDFGDGDKILAEVVEWGQSGLDQELDRLKRFNPSIDDGSPVVLDEIDERELFRMFGLKRSEPDDGLGPVFPLFGRVGWVLSELERAAIGQRMWRGVEQGLESAGELVEGLVGLLGAHSVNDEDGEAISHTCSSWLANEHRFGSTERNAQLMGQSFVAKVPLSMAPGAIDVLRLQCRICSSALRPPNLQRFAGLP